MMTEDQEKEYCKMMKRAVCYSMYQPHDSEMQLQFIQDILERINKNKGEYVPIMIADRSDMDFDIMLAFKGYTDKIAEAVLKKIEGKIGELVAAKIEAESEEVGRKIKRWIAEGSPAEETGNNAGGE